MGRERGKCTRGCSAQTETVLLGRDMASGAVVAKLCDFGLLAVSVEKGSLERARRREV